MSLDRFLKIWSIFFSISIIYILIYNILHYDPIESYDAEAHYNYLYFLAMYLPNKLLIPTIDATREFFNPPIPYLFPASIQVICRNILISEDYIKDCQKYIGTSTQVFQSILYLLTIIFYLLSFKLLKNNKKVFNLNLVLVISLFAVNYRVISMISGEIYILFFNSIFMYQLLKIATNKFNYTPKDILVSSILIGCLALSRQWSFLLLLAYIFVIVCLDKNSKIKYFKFLTYSFIFGFMISSWFYFKLFFDYGSFTSFNKNPIPLSLKNQNINFYIPFNYDALMIFYKPIRPYFSNQFLPILYSDLWGDYWGNFVFTSRNLSVGRNQLLIGSYLARVNIISLIPTIFLIYSFIVSKNLKGNMFFHKLLKYSVSITFIGYFWFLIKYPEIPTGDTIKATYIIQMFHLIGFIFASYLEDLKNKNTTFYITILTILFFVYIHNFSTYLSHFPFKF